jgi:hypothetical protein
MMMEGEKKKPNDKKKGGYLVYKYNGRENREKEKLNWKQEKKNKKNRSLRNKTIISYYCCFKIGRWCSKACSQ